MKRTAFAAAIACTLLVGACVSMSGSETVSTLPADIAMNARVEQVNLTRGDLKVTPEFNELFRTRVKAKLDGCARGTRALRLDASIHKFERTNPVITTVIAGRNVIRGEARLTEIATGKEVAVYQIGHTVVGGKLGILKMGPAEQQLSDAFGTELCNQAFATAK
jgi:hypothetical protein